MTDEETMRRLREAFASPELYLCCGPGDAEAPGLGSSCTISQVNLVTQGGLHDGPNPAVCDIVRGWVIAVQDPMPHRVRNSAEWRQAAPGIAASAGLPGRRADVREARVALLTGWMRASVRQLPGPADGALGAAWRRYADAPSLSTALALRTVVKGAPPGSMPLQLRTIVGGIIAAEVGIVLDQGTLGEFNLGHEVGRGAGWVWSSPSVLHYLRSGSRRGQRLSEHEAEQEYLRVVDPVGTLRALLAVT